MTAPRTDRPSLSDATEWARLVSESVIAGRVSLAFGAEAVESLRQDSYWDLANAVKSAVAMRRGLLSSRGFSVLGRAP